MPPTQVQSLNTEFLIAPQTALGTPADPALDSFHALSQNAMGATPLYDYIENMNQNRGVHNRASSQQAVPIRSGVRVPVTGSGQLYPNSFGAFLRGLGFASAAPTGGAGEWVHAFTKQNICDADYVSAYVAFPDCNTANTGIIKLVEDMRFTSCTITLSQQEAGMSFTGFALGETPQPAYPSTVIADSLYGLSPVSGSMNWGTLTLSNPRQHTINIVRAVDEDDTTLHSIGRNSATENDFRIDGVMNGVYLPYADYQDLVYGGGTAFSYATVVDTLDFTFDDGQSTLNSVQFDFLKVEVRLTNFDAAANNMVRADLAYKMIDDVAASPVTITCTNTVASYA